MKRHEALVPLSREHHNVLILAQLLKIDVPDYEGLPSLPEDKAAYALNMFLKDITPHFSNEERLMARVKGLDPELDRLIGEILDEHIQLKSAFAELSKADDLVTSLHVLGEKLVAHIRKEERELFPAIEANCSETQLQEIRHLFH